MGAVAGSARGVGFWGNRGMQVDTYMGAAAGAGGYIDGARSLDSARFVEIGDVCSLLF